MQTLEERYTADYVLPTLYHKGKKGAIFQWTVCTTGDQIITEYGQVDGAKQIAQKTAVPKNIGKKNATTGSSQAQAEALAMWQDKLDSKYSTTIEYAQEPLLLPMLAHKYEQKRLVLPCDIQPKLDGFRSMAVRNEEGDIKFYTRNGRTYTVPHIAAFLSEFMPYNSILDGEFYIHGVPLQKISSLVKRQQPESVDIEYHMYDVPRWDGKETGRWADRKQIFTTSLFDKVRMRMESETGSLSIVRTERCIKAEDVMNWQRKFIEDHYEGAMVRLDNGLYMYGPHSYEMMKVKSFLDTEVRVTGAHDGVGKFKGAVVWDCITTDGKAVAAVPKGTMHMRREWYKDVHKYIGKWLTIRYSVLTPDGVPFQPVAHAFRPAEDLPLELTESAL